MARRRIAPYTTLAASLVLTLIYTLPATAATAGPDRVERLSDRVQARVAGGTARLAERSTLTALPGRATTNVVYDDGEADNGYGPSPGNFADFVMRFDLPASGMKVERISPCFQRLGTGTDLDFDLTFWRADGPGGAPGDLLDFVQATAQSVPSGVNGAFFDFDLSTLDIVLPTDTVYVGVGWDEDAGEDYFVCSDYDRPSVQPGYVDVNQQGDWQDLTSQDPDYTALMIRGLFSDETTVPPGPCVPDASTLCLHGDRFRVTVDFATQTNPTPQPATKIPLSDRAGLFYFFNENNIEMLIKVLDACVDPFNRYWVFYAATTNVEFTVTVTDTEAVRTRVYTNPLGTAAPPVQDTQAFATCP